MQAKPVIALYIIESQEQVSPLEQILPASIQEKTYCSAVDTNSSNLAIQACDSSVSELLREQNVSFLYSPESVLRSSILLGDEVEALKLAHVLHNAYHFNENGTYSAGILSPYDESPATIEVGVQIGCRPNFFGSILSPAISTHRGIKSSDISDPELLNGLTKLLVEKCASIKTSKLTDYTLAHLLTHKSRQVGLLKSISLKIQSVALAIRSYGFRNFR